MSEIWKHKKSGRLYTRDRDYDDFGIKQTSDNEWESAVVCHDNLTFQPFITGLKRFMEKFEKVEEKANE